MMLPFTQLESSRKEPNETAEREIEKAGHQIGAQCGMLILESGRQAYDLYGQDKKSNDAGI
jgi:hypothetical protein